MRSRVWEEEFDMKGERKMRNRKTEEEERYLQQGRGTESVEVGKWRRRIKCQGKEKDLCKKKLRSHKRVKIYE